MMSSYAVRWSWLIPAVTFIIQVGSGHMKDTVCHTHPDLDNRKKAWHLCSHTCYVISNSWKRHFRVITVSRYVSNFGPPNYFPHHFCEAPSGGGGITHSFQSPFSHCLIFLISSAEGRCRWVELWDLCCLGAPSVQFSLGRFKDKWQSVCLLLDWPRLSFWPYVPSAHGLHFVSCAIAHASGERSDSLEKLCGKQFGFHVI